MSQHEELLPGGNVTRGVVRVGDTVRRPTGPWTASVQDLLLHLKSAGFQGAPEPLGFDDQGREVLRFVAGTPAWGDGFDQLKPARQLTRAARLIREFHEAVTSFVPPAAAKWQVLVPPDRCEIIAHHDLAPWNLIIGAQWAFIDWDTAAPGSRLWDLAWAVLGFVPLSADPRLQFPDATARMRAFVDAYGLDDEAERRRLAALLGPRARSMATFIADQAAKRIDPWLTLSRGGHGDAWRNTADYVDARIDRWLAALIS